MRQGRRRCLSRRQPALRVAMLVDENLCNHHVLDWHRDQPWSMPLMWVLRTCYRSCLMPVRELHNWHVTECDDARWREDDQRQRRSLFSGLIPGSPPLRLDASTPLPVATGMTGRAPVLVCANRPGNEFGENKLGWCYW